MLAQDYMCLNMLSVYVLLLAMNEVPALSILCYWLLEEQVKIEIHYFGLS